MKPRQPLAHSDASGSPRLVLPAGTRRVLDYGCGTGWVLAGAQAPPEAVRIGVDLFHPGLVEGSSRFPRLHFSRGDGYRLPFPDATFDAVIGHVSIPYVNTALALAEIHRVLRAGGRVWMTAHSLSYLSFRWRRTLRAGRLRDLPFPLYLLSNAILLHSGLPPQQCWWKPSLFETVHTARGIRRLLQQKGFENVRTSRTGPRIFLAFEALKPGTPRDHELAPIEWVFEPDAGQPNLKS